jgi:hypothetical protein
MEEIKDLGGLVNKDIAFSKLPQGAVYNSQNFRITTNDGSTSAARETIRGNKQVIGIPQNPCISALTFTTPLIQLLQAGVTYVIQLQINGNNVTNTLTVTYTSPSDLVTAVANFINADADFQASGITATANTTLNSFDYLFVFIIIGLLIMVIISSFQIQTHPIFFFISIFLLIIAILLSSTLANIYESIIGEADFAAAGSQYVVMGYIFQHFPTVMLIIGAILFIILFAKSRMDEYA